MTVPPLAASPAPVIRPSRDADLPAITDIYAHHVLHGTGTFETVPPTLPEMTARRAEVLGRGLPWLVAELDGRVVGYAYCNWFKPRPAYRFSAEDSIYVAHDAPGRGIGRTLLGALCDAAQAAGVRRLIAVIGDSGNAASIGVHRGAGFAMVGTLASCGWKFGRWLDVVMMDRPLGEGDTTPPRAQRRAGRGLNMRQRSKTTAAWLAFVGGPLGLHRFYLFGPGDLLGWALPIPTALGLYGIQRVLAMGQDDQLSWLLIPMLGFTIAACALNAIVYALMTPERWNARFNPQLPEDAGCGRTHWGTIGAIVASLLIGTAVLMASIVFSFQRYFEYQIEEARKISQ